MKNFLISLIALFTFTAACFAQSGPVAVAGVPVTNQVGAQGNYGLFNAGTVTVPVDANYTVVYPSTTCISCNITSSVTWTAPHIITFPVTKLMLNACNQTPGGQAMQIAYSTGNPSPAIASGSCQWVKFDGTNTVFAVTPSGSGGGATGATGPQGPQGIQGATGATGPAGASSGSSDALDSAGTINGLAVQEYRTSAHPELATWNQAVANVQTSVVTSVIWIGDSTTVVSHADNSNSGPINPLNRFADQESAYLAARSGHAYSTGFIPAIEFLIPGPDPNQRWYGPNSGTVVQDATVGPYHVFTAGTNSGVLQRATSNGSTVNWTSANTLFLEDHVKVVCLSGPGLNPWSITVNPHGGTSTTLGSGTCGGSAGSNTVSIVSVGTWGAQHTDVHLSCATAPCVMYAIAGYSGTSGSVVHNLGMASGFAEDYQVPNGFALLDAIMANEPAQRISVNFGTNEALTSVAASVYQTAEAAIVAHLQAYSSAPSVQLYVQPVCNVNDMNPHNCNSMVQMSAAARAVAAQYKTGFVSMVDATNGVIPAAYLPDGVHPTDVFTLFEWSRIKAAAYDSDGTPTTASYSSTPVYGTPTLSGTGMSFASPPDWTLDDHAFLMIFGGSSGATPGSVLATVNFGKTWVSATGAPTNPVCNFGAVLAASSTAQITMTTVDQVHLVFSVAPGSTLSGGPYAWSINCSTAGGEQ